MDEKDLENYIERAKRGNLSAEQASRYFQLAGLSGNDFDSAMSQIPVKSDPNVYIQEKKPKSSDPYANFQPIEEEQVKGAFDNDLGLINSSVVKQSEEESVNFLNNKYSRYGFQFNESTPGADFIRVTAPNGESSKFRFGESRDINEPFISDDQVEAEYQTRATDLVSFMNKNMIEDVNSINDLAKANFLNTTTFDNVDQIKEEAKSIEDQAKGTQEGLRQYDEFLNAYDVAVAQGNQESADKIAGDLRDMKKDLENSQAEVKRKGDAFDSNVGRYFSLKEDQGSTLGMMTYHFMGPGLESVVEGVSQIGITMGKVAADMSRRGVYALTDQSIAQAYEESAEAADWTDWANTVRAGHGLTKERVEEFEGRNTLTQVYSGVMESLPSFISPSKYFNILALTGQTMRHADEMMSGDEWKDVSAESKLKFTVPYVLAQVALERYGFSNMKGFSGITSKIVARAIGKAGSNVGAKTLYEIIEQDVKSAVGRAGLAGTSAFLAEAETGALQEVSSELLKKAYNQWGEKSDNFEVSETTGEFFKQVLTSAYHEGLGAFMLGGGAIYRAGRNSFTDKEMLNLSMMRDDGLLELVDVKNRQRVINGKMTAKEYEAAKKSNKRLQEIVKQIPEDANLSTQKQLFRLLQKESDLKNRVGSKGDRMSSRERSELREVQSRINKIGEDYEIMTPEQKQKEIQGVVAPTESADGNVTVEAADGSVVEIKPQEVAAQEASDNEEMEEAPQEEEGQQLSLFDESEVTAEATPTEDTPIETEAPVAEESPVASTEDVADFAEIEIDNITPEALSEAGFSTEYQSIINRVTKAVGGVFSRSKGSSIRNHRTQASLEASLKEASNMSPLKFGEFIFGAVEYGGDGQPLRVHLLDTNSTEFTESVKKAATKLGSSYRIPSATDLVSEELITHYMLYDFFGPNGTKREEFFNELESIADDNPALRALIARTRSEYSDQSEAKQQEEVIAAFFIDYRKSKDRYRGVVQRIIDWFNSKFRKGTRVINNEQDLFSVANQVVNILQGRSVKIDSKPSQQQAPDGQQPSLSRSKGDYNYLKNETVYYEFNRQSGMESDKTFTTGGSKSVPQKINVKDFFHFRNWYNKITANQEYPGIVTKMYYIKDGKKQTINPPKPKVDSEGNKVKMDRIPTFKQIKGARRMRDQATNAEMRRQYSVLSREVGDLWYDAGFNVYTTLRSFYPDGESSTELDFEGLVIAKKNIQAAIDSGITKEQLKDLKGNRDSISKEDNPDLFNMSGLSRISSPEEHGTVHHPESRGLSFAKSTPRKTFSSKEGRKRINAKDLPVNSISLKYDVGATTEYTLQYGDKEYTFKTSGGVSEVAEYEGEGLSASHSTVDQRRTTLKMLKYFEVVLNDDMKTIESYLRAPIEAKKKAIEKVKEKRKKPRLDARERQEIKKYEAEIKNFEDTIPSQLEEAKALKESLKKDKGLVTIYIHLNDPKSIVGRPQIFKDLSSLLFRAVETENSVEFTDRLLKDLASSIGAIPKAKKAFVGLYGQSELVNPSLEVMEEFFRNENDDLAFQGRIDLILRLPMFKSKGDRGSRDEIYNGFPSLKDDLWRQVTDDYYWDNLSEFFLIDRESTSGYALNAMTVDLNKLFSAESTDGGKRSAVVKTKGTDFGYYIGGLDTVYDLESIVSIKKSTSRDGKQEAAKDTYISKIEFDEAQWSKEISKLKKELKNTDPSKAQTIKGLKGQIERLERAVPTIGQTTKRYTSLPAAKSALYRDISKAIGEGMGPNEISYSKASGRVSKQVVEKSGAKGVSVNQLMQVAGKGSKAEQLVITELIEKFPDSDFIPKEDLDMFFDGKMLEPLDDSRNHSDYGLERVLGSSYRKAKSVTVPFLGDSEIYGTPGIFEDHFRFPTHAHIRMFTHPDNPGVTYVSELQSDTYQRGLKDAFNDDLTDDIIVSDYGSDEFDISVENLDLLKYIVDNYRQYRSMLVDAAGSIQNARIPKFWSDITESIESVSEKNSTNKPNIANILSNVLESNPEFNVNAFRVVLRLYATSDLNAPVKSTDKQIEAVIDDAFNRYPFIQEGEDTNLAKFAKDVSITIEHISDTIPDIVWDGDNVEGMTQEEREEAYGRVVEAVEENRSKVDRDIKEGVSSAKNSWEKQLIRYAIKKAQGDGSRVVRFPTEGTAATIQWWSEGEDALADQVPLRKRYRDLPKTLKSMGLEAKIERDQRDNAWYEIETPSSDTRLVMFSRQGKSNVGDVGGATWAQREQSRNEELTDKWLVRFQDKYRRVFKLQEDVAKKTRGQVKESEDFRMAEERMYGRAANDLEVLDGIANQITEQLKEEGLTIAEVDEYMYALHAKERNAVISERTDGENEEGSGKSDAWADETLLRISTDKKAKLERVAATVRNVQQMTRNTMVELGLETQETIDAFEKMFSNYVPLQGTAKDEDSIDFSPYPSGGAGFSVSGATTKKAKGRKTESVDIVAQVISQNAAVNIKGRTNEAMNALFKLAENNPNQDVWAILDKEKDNYREDDPNIVSVRVNGVQKAIRFKDASYAQSLRTMNLPQKNLFVKYMGTLNSWLRAAFTSRNPEFILSNFSRDIQSAVFNASSEAEIEGGFLNGTDAMARIFKMVSPSLKALIREEVGAKGDPLIMKYYEEFKEDGGKTGWAYQKSLEDIASDLEIDDSGETGAQKVIGGVKKGLEFIEGMNDAFENSIRLSSYIAAREAGVSRGKAAQFAKNITVNFNKQGEWGAAMNATFLFFNASVQGTARLGRSLINPKPVQRPDGSNREWYERASTAQKAALGMVIMNGLLTLLNRAASDEDEDEVLFFNKIPDYVKERNMIIMRPDGENYWKIPMPYGYNIFANAGSVAVEVASGDKPALEGLAFMASTMINAFSPISFGQSENLARMTAKSAIPTAFKPFFDAFAFNETYFGGPVMAEQYPFGTPKPKSSMSFRSPEELKQFFSWMNEVTGGSENVPGVIDVNPDGAWYIMEYFMGGTGKFVERSIETGRKIAADTYENPVDLDFNDVPFLRILYGEPSKYYDMQKFKEREVEIKQLVSEYKSNRVEDPGNRYNSIGPLDSYLKKINKALKVVRAEKRDARKIRSYEERVSKIQALMERERKIVMMFNKKYDELRGEN